MMRGKEKAYLGELSRAYSQLHSVGVIQRTRKYIEKAYLSSMFRWAKISKIEWALLNLNSKMQGPTPPISPSALHTRRRRVARACVSF